MSAEEIDVYKEWLGIPEGDRPPDHYTLLRLVQFEDDDDRIRRNYVKLNTHVRKYASGQYSVQSQELLNELAKSMLCLTDPDRKREYDKDQGREIGEKENLRRKQLGQILADEGIISSDQVKEAESFAMARGLSMRDAVVQMKLADAASATKAYAQELGYGYVDLQQTTPDDSVLDKIPRSFVKRNSLLPLFEDDDVLLVACVHEPTPDVEEELRLRYEMPVRPVLATPLAINQALARYYAPGAREERPDAESAKGGKKKPARPARAAAPRSSEPKSAADPRQQKLLRVLMCCWFTIAAVLVDKFLLKADPFLLTWFVAPAAIGTGLYFWFKT